MRNALAFRVDGLPHLADIDRADDLDLAARVAVAQVAYLVEKGPHDLHAHVQRIATREHLSDTVTVVDRLAIRQIYACHEVTEFVEPVGKAKARKHAKS